jgi:hypothetical protein
MLLFTCKYEYNYSIWRSTMKKLLATLILCAGMGSCATAHADRWHHGGGHYVYRPNYGWVAPVVIGGIIGYEINRAQQPNVVIVQPQPVYPPPAVPYWPQPADYHWEAILDANCNCYRTVLVRN